MTRRSRVWTGELQAASQHLQSPERRLQGGRQRRQSFRLLPSELSLRGQEAPLWPRRHPASRQTARWVGYGRSPQRHLSKHIEPCLNWAPTFRTVDESVGVDVVVGNFQHFRNTLYQFVYATTNQKDLNPIALQDFEQASTTKARKRDNMGHSISGLSF